MTGGIFIKAFVSSRNIFFITLSIFLCSGAVNSLIKNQEKITPIPFATQDLKEIRQKNINSVHKEDSGEESLQASTAVEDAQRTLVIGVPAKPAFEGFVMCKEKGVEPTGYCIDVFKAAADNLKQKLSYKFKFDCYNRSYNELVANVKGSNATISKRYDAAVGDITILANRSKLVDFTMPYMESSLTMVVRKEEEMEEWLFVKPFTSTVWLSILLVFVLTMSVVWFMEHRSNPDFKGRWTHQLSTALWFTFSTLFYAHRERIQSNYTRAVMFVWFCAVYVIVTSYQASLTSMLTVPHLKPQVTNYMELVENDDIVGCDKDSFVGTYLQKVLGFHPKNIRNITSEKGFLDEFKKRNNPIKAAFLELPYAEIFLHKNSKDYKDSGERHRFGGFAFAFPQGSSLTAAFSEAILILSENGTINSLHKNWFPTNSPDSTSSSKIEEQRLSLVYLKGLFLVTGISPMVMLILYIIWGRRHDPPTDPVNTGAHSEPSHEPHPSPPRNVNHLDPESLDNLYAYGQRQQSQVGEVQLQETNSEDPGSQTRPLRQAMSFAGPDRRVTGVSEASPRQLIIHRPHPTM